MPRASGKVPKAQECSVPAPSPVNLGSSRPTRSTRMSRSLSIRQAVRNSSDVSDDDTDIPSHGTVAVVIPPSDPSRAASTFSASGASAVFDAPGSLLTPDTSSAGTPFGVDKRQGRTGAANLSRVNNKLATPASGRSTRNRSRTMQEEQMSADEALARGLQAEFYDEPAPAKKGAKKSATRGNFRLSAMVSDDDDEGESSRAPLAVSARSSKKSVPKIPLPFSDDEDDYAALAIAAKPNKRKGAIGKEKIVVSMTDDDLDYDIAVDSLGASEDDVFDPDVSEDEIAPVSKKRKGKGKAPITRVRKRTKIRRSDPVPLLQQANAESPADHSIESPLSSTYTSDLDTATNRDMSHFEQKYPRTEHGRKPQTMTRTDWERKKLDNSHPMLKTLWSDLERDVPIIQPTPDPQPADINRQLKIFQREGLNWMRRMETEARWKGGLLGDEMGMGKTIQAVSLIMSDYPAGKPTLVVLPPVALMQWSQEITSYTDGKLNILVHHNSDPKVKKLKVKELLKYDVILISYAGLESAHRKEIKGWKRDDGLVKENSKIHSIQFHRLILDEAHSIKTRTTQVARACFALKSDYKWCLSGTPVQNRIGEFFSLLRFLEVSPFANYFCKACPCTVIHWEKDEHHSCVECGHRGFDHVSLFNQELLNPMTSGDAVMRKEAMHKLRLITDRIMLRRLKKDHTASMELPPKMVVVHREFFGEKERDFSKSIMSNTARQFDTYVARGVMLNNYANIFGLIMQMRQVANHPDLILKKKAEGGQNVLVCCICDEPAEEPIRSVCHHEFCRQCAKNYVRGFIDAGSSPDCPQCHIALKIDFDQPDVEQDEDAVKKSSIINRIKMENWTSSTKIEMLVYDLYKLRSKKQTVKSIVFSQFTSMLQLIDWRLRRAGFNTVMLDGTMTPQQRQNSIEYFMNNVHVEVFLVSLKAGGVALNLTEASHVFIVDPWWNPAAEWQSADRVHRIGQLRPCVITRLVIEDSVESRMVLLQEKKANLINSTVNRDDVALDKLSPEDMQFLFRGS